jgi:Tol biopolymer transport system component
LAYCAERNGNFDIYTIPVDGGEKKRLTISDGLDDGPDYSSDGKYIYFNSYRTGHMQIWRMQSDGTNQEQLTLMIIQIGLHIHHLITNGSYLFHTV